MPASNGWVKVYLVAVSHPGVLDDYSAAVDGGDHDLTARYAQLPKQVQ